MFIKTRFPTTVSGLGRVAANQLLALSAREAMPLIAAGNASPRYDIAATQEDDELKRLKEKARKLGQRVDWDKEPDHPRAVTVMASATGAYYPPGEESFAAKLKRAVEAATAARPRCETVKQHAERVERERQRYKPFKRRARTKGE